jgi:hypothetical protein
MSFLVVFIVFVNVNMSSHQEHRYDCKPKPMPEVAEEELA